MTGTAARSSLTYMYSLEYMYRSIVHADERTNISLCENWHHMKIVVYCSYTLHHNECTKIRMEFSFVQIYVSYIHFEV